MIATIMNIVLALKPPYYHNPNIHNFGNIGLGGYIHARLAPFATRTIDNLCYDGRNIRQEIYQSFYYQDEYNQYNQYNEYNEYNQYNEYNEYNETNKGVRVLDLCCGTGISTPPGGVGIDTSNEMLGVAREIHCQEKTRFYSGNAETYRPDFPVEHVSCMFAFHEMPLYAQRNVIENAISIAEQSVVIVDIAPTYNPSPTMLLGEPYILDYLGNIEEIMYDYNFLQIEYIPSHVYMWIHQVECKEI